MSVRERFSGDTCTILAVVKDHITADGIDYDENGPLNPRKILKLKPLITGLKLLQANLCFKMDTLKIVFTRLEVGNTLSKAERKKWIVDNAKKLSFVCSAVMKACRRKSPPGWAVEINGGPPSVAEQLGVFDVRTYPPLNFNFKMFVLYVWLFMLSFFLGGSAGCRSYASRLRRLILEFLLLQQCLMDRRRSQVDLLLSHTLRARQLQSQERLCRRFRGVKTHQENDIK